MQSTARPRLQPLRTWPAAPPHAALTPAHRCALLRCHRNPSACLHDDVVAMLFFLEALGLSRRPGKVSSLCRRAPRLPPHREANACKHPLPGGGMSRAPYCSMAALRTSTVAWAFEPRGKSRLSRRREVDEMNIFLRELRNDCKRLGRDTSRESLWPMRFIFSVKWPFLRASREGDSSGKSCWLRVLSRLLVGAPPPLQRNETIRCSKA